MNWIHWQLTLLRDRDWLPAMAVTLIDWIRYLDVWKQPINDE